VRRPTAEDEGSRYALASLTRSRLRARGTDDGEMPPAATISIAELVAMLQADDALKTTVASASWTRFSELYAQYTVRKINATATIPVEVVCVCASHIAVTH
jgi:hypothetical protein